MIVLAVDQGTTGTTTLAVDAAGQIVARAYREFPQHYPQPGWVEHDADDIWSSVVETVTEVLAQLTSPVIAVGITNQRETTVVWERDSGKPVHRAIVWQCRRTADACSALRRYESDIRARSGLPVDAYFSGTKLRWLLDRTPQADEKLCFGTIDSWLIWRLTGGQVHATDYTNASRTQLFNIERRAWDAQLCEWIGVPMTVLPEARPSRGDFGKVRAIPGLEGVPIRAVLGDQQAALYGQACHAPGSVKNTYGTGAFVVMNTGAQRVDSAQGLVTTLAVDGEGRSVYALEGSVFIAGAAVQWLRDELGVIRQAAETEALALSLVDNGGVYLVPAFVGLGAPWWDMGARGALLGLTRGAGRAHLARAALEAMAYQTVDVMTAMLAESGVSPAVLAVDGGASANNFLLQFQADMLSLPVERPVHIESTSMGAAWLAGLDAGLWTSAELDGLRRIDRRFLPVMAAVSRDACLNGWHDALKKVRTYGD